jgi:cell division protein FtsB
MTYLKPQTYSCINQSKGMSFVSVLLVLGFAVLILTYIMQVNSVVSQGYQLRQAKENIEKLQKENQKLQIEVAQLQFPSNLEEIAVRLQMVENDQVAYLGSDGMALRP